MNDNPVSTLANWFTQDHDPLVLKLDRLHLFLATSALQLAARHPGVGENVSPHLKRLVGRMQSLMPDDIRAISLLGDDPALDVPPPM